VAHAWPQLPQFFGSLERSTQLEPQAVFGGWHIVVQALASQRGVIPLQTLPQAPQFLGSLLVLVHMPPQFWSPGGQPPSGVSQVPPEQV
jgi:hypothetical protein